MGAEDEEERSQPLLPNEHVNADEKNSRCGDSKGRINSSTLTLEPKEWDKSKIPLLPEKINAKDNIKIHAIDKNLEKTAHAQMHARVQAYLQSGQSEKMRMHRNSKTLKGPQNINIRQVPRRINTGTQVQSQTKLQIRECKVSRSRSSSSSMDIPSSRQQEVKIGIQVQGENNKVQTGTILDSKRRKLKRKRSSETEEGGERPLSQQLESTSMDAYSLRLREKKEVQIIEPQDPIKLGRHEVQERKKVQISDVKRLSLQLHLPNASKKESQEKVSSQRALIGATKTTDSKGAIDIVDAYSLRLREKKEVQIIEPQDPIKLGRHEVQERKKVQISDVKRLSLQLHLPNVIKNKSQEKVSSQKTLIGATKTTNSKGAMDMVQVQNGVQSVPDNCIDKDGTKENIHTKKQKSPPIAQEQVLVATSQSIDLNGVQSVPDNCIDKDGTKGNVHTKKRKSPPIAQEQVSVATDVSQSIAKAHITLKTSQESQPQHVLNGVQSVPDNCIDKDGTKGNVHTKKRKSPPIAQEQVSVATVGTQSIVKAHITLKTSHKNQPQHVLNGVQSEPDKCIEKDGTKGNVHTKKQKSQSRPQDGVSVATVVSQSIDKAHKTLKTSQENYSNDIVQPIIPQHRKSSNEILKDRNDKSNCNGIIKHQVCTLSLERDDLVTKEAVKLKKLQPLPIREHHGGGLKENKQIPAKTKPPILIYSKEQSNLQGVQQISVETSEFQSKDEVRVLDVDVPKPLDKGDLRDVVKVADAVLFEEPKPLSVSNQNESKTYSQESMPLTMHKAPASNQNGNEEPKTCGDQKKSLENCSEQKAKLKHGVNASNEGNSHKILPKQLEHISNNFNQTSQEVTSKQQKSTVNHVSGGNGFTKAELNSTVTTQISGQEKSPIGIESRDLEPRIETSVPSDIASVHGLQKEIRVDILVAGQEMLQSKATVPVGIKYNTQFAKEQLGRKMHKGRKHNRELHRLTRDHGVEKLSFTPAAKSDADNSIITNPNESRPKRIIKSVQRYEDIRLTQKEQAELKRLKLNCGAGFLCPEPSCKTQLNYDSKKCWKCGVSCGYFPGMGVMRLKDRSEVGKTKEYPRKRQGGKNGNKSKPSTNKFYLSHKKARKILANAETKECEACLQLFLPSYLQRHRRRTHKLESDVGCPYCKFTCQTMEERNEHINQKHAGEQLHLSEEERSKNLLYIYACPLCDTAMAYSDLRNHLIVEHQQDFADVQHKITCTCPFCLQGSKPRRTRFLTADALLNHVKLSHPGCTISGKKVRLGGASVDKSIAQKSGTRAKRQRSASVNAKATPRTSTRIRNVSNYEEVNDKIETEEEFSADEEAPEIAEPSPPPTPTSGVDESYWFALGPDILTHAAKIGDVIYRRGQPIQSVLDVIDKKIKRLQERDKFADDGRNEDDDIYVAENKLYVRGIRERTNKSESEALEKFMYKDQCEQRQRVFDYQNRAKKKSREQVELEEFLSRPFRMQKEGDRSSSATRRATCPFGDSDSCDLCNGWYANWIVTKEEIVQAGGSVNKAIQCLSGENSHKFRSKKGAKEKKKISIPSRGFRRITDADLPDDLEPDDLNLQRKLTAPAKTQRQRVRARPRRNDKGQLWKLMHLKHSLEFVKSFNKGIVISKSRK